MRTRLALALLAILAALTLAGCPNGTPSDCPSGATDCGGSAPGGY